jgi:hypothetical protein
MRNVSDASCGDNQDTYYMFNNIFFFFFENRAVYETKRENVFRARQARDDNKAHAHCMLDN